MNFKMNNCKKAAVLAAVLGGVMLGQTACAADFNDMITGRADDVYAEAGVKDGANYTFSGENSITIAADTENNKYGADASAGISIKKVGEFVVDAGKKLSISVKGDNQFNKGIFFDSMAMGAGAKSLTVNGEQVEIEVEGDKTQGIGTFARNTSITVNAGVKMTVGGPVESLGVKATADSEITINGPLSIKTDAASKNAAALYITDTDAMINVNFQDGKALHANQPVQLDGDIYVLQKGEEYDTPRKGIINLALSGKDSYLHGVSGYMEGEEDDGDMFDPTITIIKAGEANIVLERNATWRNQRHGSNTGSEWEGFHGSHVTSLTGGASAEEAGIIEQLDKDAMDVEMYNGHVKVIYAHDEAAPATIKGGDLKIAKAAEGSGIVLVTDNTGLNTSSKDEADKQLVADTLNALAGKLYYGAYVDGEKNLTGKVQIAEGLTAASATLKAGDIAFKDENGQGEYVPVEDETEEPGGDVDPGETDKPGTEEPGGDVDPREGGNPDTEEPGGDVDPGETDKPGTEEPGGDVDPGETDKPGTEEPGGDVDPGETDKPGIEEPGDDIELGSEETVMMRGVKNALASSAVMWRNSGSDLHQHLGDVRLGREDMGVWAKYRGGKTEMDSQAMDFSTKYNSFTVGFDKEIGGNWLVGGAISQLDGDGTYREGTGDLKQTDFTVYGTKVTGDGQYLDLVAKAGQLKNDFRIANGEGHKLEGDYKATGVSLSAEYGKRFVQDNGFYIDPSLRLTLGRIGGKYFDAVSDMKDGKGGFKSMHVEQDAFTSAVGRLGLSVGKQAGNYNAFAKMVLAHEFSGAFDTAFSATEEAQGSKTRLELKDTWFELEVGGSAKIGNGSYLYGSFARTMGGDITDRWRVDTGVRFSF